MNTLAQNSTPAPTAPGENGKRRLRNYLLDARFQLKFTGYLVATALAVAGLLGAFLWSSTQALLRQTEAAVEARSRAADTSKALSSALLNNKLMEHLSDPTFDKQLAEQSKVIDSRYEEEEAAVLAQRDELRRQQQRSWWILLGCLAGFVVFIALATIVTTHRIVGPLFRIKRLIQAVGEGKLNVPAYPLRQGDELQDLFGALTSMIEQLRHRQAEDLRAINQLRERAEKAQVVFAPELRSLETRLKERLE